MTRRKIAPTGLAVAVMTSVMFGASAAEARFDREGTTISDTQVDFRQPFVIKGRVVDDETGELCTGGQITVSRRPVAGDPTREVGVDEDDGEFEFELQATANADYILNYSGGDTAGCLRDSGSFTQKVYRAMPTRVTRDGVLRGAVRPSWQRRTVIIQTRRAGEWKRYERVRTNNKGRYASKLRIRPGRETIYRAMVPATKDYVRSTSDAWGIR